MTAKDVAEKPARQWWVYIIESDKGNLYTGITTDIARRWQEHCAVARGDSNARGAKFFRSQSPRIIVYQEPFASRSEASRQESVIKQMTRQQKQELVKIRGKAQRESRLSTARSLTDHNQSG